MPSMRCGSNSRANADHHGSSEKAASCMSEPYRTVEIAYALLNSLPRLQLKVAVVLKYAAGETSELLRRLRELDEPAAE